MLGNGGLEVGERSFWRDGEEIEGYEEGDVSSGRRNNHDKN